MISTLQGYPFYGTGAAAPTAHNATLMDPVLEATVTTLTLRGRNRKVKVQGVSFISDVPALGSRMELRLGNQCTPSRVIDVLPVLDGDLVSQPVHSVNYIDLGGIIVDEQELVDIRLYDPGAAENMSGVLWVEDMEAEIPIPKGQIITLKCGGTNDSAAAGAFGTTGFDLDSRKLVNERLYTPFMVTVRAEDKVIQRMTLRADKDVMTLPPHGTMVYKSAPLQFTGQQYNASQVIGKIGTQAETKHETVIYLVESEIPGGSKAVNAAPINNEPSVTPGVISLGQLIGGTKPVAQYKSSKLYTVSR